jgi:hypothetical protein
MGGNLHWKLASPLEAPAALVILDLQGREWARYSLAVGQSSGSVASQVAPGLFTGYLEMQGARKILK